MLELVTLCGPHSKTQVHNAQGDVVRTSQNLRGLLTHARDLIITGIETWSTPAELGYMFSAIVLVRFENGDFCLTTFSDYSVLVDWIAKRRSWKGALVSHHDRRAHGRARLLHLLSTLPLQNHITLQPPRPRPSRAH